MKKKERGRWMEVKAIIGEKEKWNQDEGVTAKV